MGTKKSVTGTCLCGSVSVSGEIEEKIFDACHCGMCRKWSGNPAMTVIVNPDLKFKGEDMIGVYSSSEWADRGFCKKCGTHLFYRLKNQKLYSIPLGLLDNTEDFKFHVQIFVDSKPHNYEFANKTAMMTEAEVLAKFGGG